MRRLAGVAGAAALAGVGLLSALLLAGCGGGGGGQAGGAVSTALSNVSVTRQATTVTEEAPATPPGTVTQVQTVTAPATTSAQVTIATVQPESTSTGDVSPWVWVLLGAGAIAAVALIVHLLRHRELSLDERQKRLFAALSGWTTRGWTVDLQGADSAVLSRDGEHVRVTVDGRGEVASNRLVPG